MTQMINKNMKLFLKTFTLCNIISHLIIFSRFCLEIRFYAADFGPLFPGLYLFQKGSAVREVNLVRYLTGLKPIA